MSRKKPIRIEIKDTLEVYPDGIYESVVTKSGNGAVIPFYKRFLDSEVIVIVKDKLKLTDPEWKKYAKDYMED